MKLTSPVGTVIPSLDDPTTVYVECAECQYMFETKVDEHTFVIDKPCPTCERVMNVGKRGYEPLRLGFFL